MSMVKNHADLLVWRKSIALAGRIYRSTHQFPAAEQLQLSQQMRQCAVSVASQIAEGAGRGTRVEYIRFLDLARSSLATLDTQLHISAELGWLDEPQPFHDAVAEIRRLLTALIRKLREEKVAGGYFGRS